MSEFALGLVSPGGRVDGLPTAEITFPRSEVPQEAARHNPSTTFRFTTTLTFYNLFKQVISEMLRLLQPRFACPKLSQVRRLYASSGLDPFLQGYVKRLAEVQPCFTAGSRNVRVMHEPSEFYQCLLVGAIL